jgi:hypothetical protein
VHSGVFRNNYSHSLTRDIWKQADSFNYNGRAAKTLSPEYHLVHICAHGFAWNPEPPIRWVADAVKILSTTDINWALLVDSAIRFDLHADIVQSLEYLSNVWREPVPDQAINEEFAALHFQVEIAAVKFDDNRVIAGDHDLSFTEFVQLAYMNRISLSATGFYRTPKIHYDRDSARGRPFFYYAYGAAVSEVLIDTLTGEYKVTRADTCQDVGLSLNPAIDIGQVEGGYIQGMGWVTTEELVWGKPA